MLDQPSIIPSHSQSAVLQTATEGASTNGGYGKLDQKPRIGSGQNDEAK